MQRVIVAVVGEDGMLSGDGPGIVGVARSRTGAIRVAREAGWRVLASETQRDHDGSWLIVSSGRR